MDEQLTKRQQIEKRFNYNIERVENLIGIFEYLQDSTVNNRRDVLRAAVVFLHAALEDVIRQLLVWKLPGLQGSIEEFFTDTREPGRRRAERIEIAELARKRECSTREFVRRLIKERLDDSTFNDVPEVVRALTLLRLDQSQVKPRVAAFAKAMKRRHDIVHQSDREELGNETHGKRRTLNEAEVSGWVRGVKALMEYVFMSLDEQPAGKKTAKAKS